MQVDTLTIATHILREVCPHKTIAEFYREKGREMPHTYEAGYSMGYADAVHACLDAIYSYRDPSAQAF